MKKCLKYYKVSYTLPNEGGYVPPDQVGGDYYMDKHVSITMIGYSIKRVKEILKITAPMACSIKCTSIGVV